MGLPASLRRKINLPEKMAEAVARVLCSEELPKGHLLFRAGDTCRRIFFIEKGLARVFHAPPDGKDITLWFCAEDAFLTPLDSFARNTPTQDNCELLEPSVIHSCEFTQLGGLMLDHPDMAMAGFFIAMELLQQFSERFSNQRFLSARDRYDALVASQREIFLRAPLGDIASYLGMTQETLSRLRAEKR